MSFTISVPFRSASHQHNKSDWREENSLFWWLSWVGNSSTMMGRHNFVPVISREKSESWPQEVVRHNFETISKNRTHVQLRVCADVVWLLKNDWTTYVLVKWQHLASRRTWVAMHIVVSFFITQENPQSVRTHSFFFMTTRQNKKYTTIWKK